MSAYINFLNELINKNNSQYPAFNNQIQWIGYYEAFEKEEERKNLLEKLNQKLNWSFKNTKPWINSLSKGCELCGQGEWSCLFITGKCNANCFYCPANQEHDGIPSTQLTSFDNPEDYIAYLEYFGFKGSSLSGGEPLMVFERTLEYVTKIKQHFGNNLYLWMYTNGLLGSEDKFKQIANAGIDEIRFDIGATNYNLKFFKYAQGIIPNLTVEIPAVPEEFDKLKQVIPELIELGVTNLNLHQLRLTNYNAPKLLKRNYTYLHSEQATVMESELTALKLIEFVADNNLPIGVNYCAFHFKNRFQKAGFRKKIASKFIEENAQLTENGFLRTLKDKNQYYFIGRNKLITDKDSNIDIPEELEISFKGLILDDHIENDLCIKKFTIGNKTYFLRTGLAQKAMQFDKSETQQFLQLFNTQGAKIPEEDNLFPAWKSEFIEWNLREYF